MFRLAYFVTHPVQYQAPLLRLLADCGQIDLHVYFLCDFSIHRHHEPAFNATFQWDVPLINGYRSEVLTRWLIGRSSPKRPCWPVRGIECRLRDGRFNAIWVHGWGHLGLLQAVRSARAMGLPVLLRAESTPDQSSESAKRSWRRRLRDAFCRHHFQGISGFMCIGSRNRQFYRQFGVAEHRMFHVPYAVDNHWFQARCKESRSHREDLRKQLKLTPERPTILFAAKFTPLKAPDELLNSFSLLCSDSRSRIKPYLLFVGDGPLRGILQQRARALGDSSGNDCVLLRHICVNR